MKRVNIFLEVEQIKYLKGRPGTLSDNIREFIERCRREDEAKSVSSSESKRGDAHE